MRFHFYTDRKVSAFDSDINQVQVTVKQGTGVGVDNRLKESKSLSTGYQI